MKNFLTRIIDRIIAFFRNLWKRTTTISAEETELQAPAPTADRSFFDRIRERGYLKALLERIQQEWPILYERPESLGFFEARVREQSPSEGLEGRTAQELVVAMCHYKLLKQPDGRPGPAFRVAI